MRSSCLLFLMSLLLFSCGNRGYKKGVSSVGDTLNLHYATNLKIIKYDNYTEVILRNPWDTLKTLHKYILVDKKHIDLDDVPKDGTIIHIPLDDVMVYSSVHCSLLQQLGCVDKIAGVCDLKYIKLPIIQERCSKEIIVNCGDGLNPDIEKIIMLHPQAIFLSPFQNSGGYGRIEKLNIPIVECADYMETSALGRSEWMKFFGVLFGREQQADSLFRIVESSYIKLKQIADTVRKHPSVLSELQTGAAWYVPGGRSTTGRLFTDAGGKYVFADNNNSGSVPYSFEEVFARGSKADIWIFKYNAPYRMTYKRILEQKKNYSAFKAYKDRQMYACNTGEVPFYEEAPFRPDYLLSDYIQIFHPQINLGGLHYFYKLNE